jgi:hypothetical protein
MACSMGTSVGYDRARNKVSGGPMAHPLAHCQLESRFQSDTFVSTLTLCQYPLGPGLSSVCANSYSSAAA